MEFLKLFVRQNPNADVARAELRRVMDWKPGKIVLRDPVLSYPGLVIDYSRSSRGRLPVSRTEVVRETDAIIWRLMNAE